MLGFQQFHIDGHDHEVVRQTSEATISRQLSEFQISNWDLGANCSGRSGSKWGLFDPIAHLEKSDYSMTKKSFELRKKNKFLYKFFKKLLKAI